METVLTITHWFGGCLLAFTFLGYPVLIGWLGRRREERAPLFRPPARSSTPPFVSVVLVVRDEENRVIPRIRNLFETDHPEDRMEVIVVSDGSTDETCARIQELPPAPAPVHLIEHSRHRGKPAGLNAGVAAASGEIVVFADARQLFTRATIPALVASFTDPAVGAVGGELDIDPSDTGVAAGVDAYWRLEKLIRRGESRIDSAIGCTGAVYAIRRECFDPLPEDTILDDVVCPMRIALRGRRVLFCPEAVAFDPQPLSPASEKRRKRRTLCGNFQMLFRYPSWLLPWRNRLFFQLVSHKYLRLAAPFLLATTFCSAAILAGQGSLLHAASAAVQGGLYLAAAIGLAIPGAKNRFFSFPAAFVFLNVMTIFGLADYLRNGNRTGW